MARHESRTERQERNYKILGGYLICNKIIVGKLLQILLKDNNMDTKRRENFLNLRIRTRYNFNKNSSVKHEKNPKVLALQGQTMTMP